MAGSFNSRVQAGGTGLPMDRDPTSPAHFWTNTNKIYGNSAIIGHSFEIMKSVASRDHGEPS